MGFLKLLDYVVSEHKVEILFNERYKNQLAPSFLIFDYFDTNELVLSGILADLLNPLGKHGQGETFLKHFLNSLKLHETWKQIVLEKSHVTIRLEEQTHRSQTARRMDIFIEIKYNNQEFAICIENKPFARDQVDQLKDYAHELDQRYRHQWQIIYLNGQGNAPSSLSVSPELLTQWKDNNQYNEVSYADLIPWLDQCVFESQNPRVSAFLSEFKSYISKKFITSIDMNEQNIMVENILHNPDHLKAVIEVETLKRQVQNNLLSKLKKELEKLARESGYQVDGELNLNAHSAIFIYSDRNQEFQFCMEFDRGFYTGFFIGIMFRDFKNATPDKQQFEYLHHESQKKFSSLQIGKSIVWPAYLELPEYLNWNINGDIWLEIQNGTFSEKLFNYFQDFNEIIRSS